MKFTPLQGAQLGEIAAIAIKALLQIPPLLETIASEISSCDTRLENIRVEIQALESTTNQQLTSMDNELNTIATNTK